MWCLCAYVGPSLAVVPRYLPREQTINKPSLVVDYFKQGFMNYEIVAFLLIRHGIEISVRTVKRILRRYNLKRWTCVHTQLDNVVNIIEREIHNCGKCIGYRAMWRRLKIDHNIHIRRDDVMAIMKALDPIGVEFRKAHRLQRRVYCAKGPNYIWHIDGYDKLKPYGFCIHGAIDGFSRKIMWLEVSDSNNDPRLVAKYYLDALSENRKAPRCLRCDAGTENSIVLLLQQFFRHNDTDHFAGSRSIIVGKSTSNQRIERWWCTLRNQGLNRWINFFKDLRDSGQYDELDPLHCDNLKFCFMHLIQTDLDRIAQQWNVHHIRPQNNTATSFGKPDTMFFLPAIFETRDYGCIIDTRDVQVCKEMYSRPKRYSEDFENLARLLNPALQMPLDAEEGLQLFLELNTAVSRMDQL